MFKSKGFSVILLFIILAILGGMALVAYAYRFKIWEYRLKKEQLTLPRAVGQQEAVFQQDLGQEIKKQEIVLRQSSGQGIKDQLPADNILTPAATEDSVVKNEEQLPLEINLSVPFTAQAPFAIWDVLHEDACEEASVVMVARFYKNQTITGPADADEEIKKLAAWEDQNFGFNKDTSAELTARMLKEYYGFADVIVKYDSEATIEMIKKELISGRPVIVPNFGQALKNPFFRAPGPVYHMIVIKGYTKDDKFIVNDPGTKRGADFIYKQDTLMKAINDWDDENNRLSGRKAMIVVQ